MEKFDLKVRRLLYNVDEEKIKLYKTFQKVLFKKNKKKFYFIVLNIYIYVI